MRNSTQVKICLIFSHEISEIRMYVLPRCTVVKNQSLRMIYVPDDRAPRARCVKLYGIRDVHTTSTYHLIDGLALKDNDQCGRYYVNDLADVSKMRLRVAGYPRDRFVITTTVCEFGGLRLTERRTNNENGRGREGLLELGFVVYYGQLSEITLTWLMIERTTVQFRGYAIYHNIFSRGILIHFSTRK